MIRILGIDYGDARVGVAVSDMLGMTAQGVKTIKNTGGKRLIEELAEIINEYKPSKIVIGMPRNMDGTEGFRAEATRKFAKRLGEVYDGDIAFWDERLSSLGAKRYLNETNTRGRKRKSVLDTVAACIILEGYLTANH